jgi:predicted Zn finger-like uncharacterized protein
MNTTVSCPGCGAQYSVQRELLGRRSKCSKCGSAFTLSESPPTAVPENAMPPSVAPAAAVEAPPDFAGLSQIEVAPPATRTRPARPSPPPAAVASPTTTVSSFRVLRLMAKSYEVFAVISLIAIMIPIVLLVQAVVQYPTLASLYVIPYCSAIVSLLAAAVVFFFLAQLIRLVLQVEQNTRETSAACRQLVEHLCGIESAE